MENITITPAADCQLERDTKKRNNIVQASLNHYTNARLLDYAEDFGVGKNTAGGMVITLFFKKLEQGKILP